MEQARQEGDDIVVRCASPTCRSHVRLLGGALLPYSERLADLLDASGWRLQTQDRHHGWFCGRCRE